MVDIDSSGYASRYFKEFIDAVKANAIELERKIGKLEEANKKLEQRIVTLEKK